MAEVVPIGTIKVAWLDKDQKNVLNSKMFLPTEKDAAVAFGQEKGNFVLMQLKEGNDGVNYIWNVLPEGCRLEMDIAAFIFDNKILLIITILLLIVGLHTSFTYIRNQL